MSKSEQRSPADEMTEFSAPPSLPQPQPQPPQPPPPPLSMDNSCGCSDVEIHTLKQKSLTVFCKICHSGGSCEQLIQPCNCRGTIGNVHLSCLERWLNERNFDRCELCLFEFTTEHIRRYSALQSIVIWARNPSNRTILYSDLIVMSILTTVAVFLMSIMIGIMIKMDNSSVGSYTDLMVRCLILVCIFVVMAGYVFSMFMIIGSSCVTWYTWWRNCIEIRLNRECLSEQLP